MNEGRKVNKLEGKQKIGGHEAVTKKGGGETKETKNTKKYFQQNWNVV